MKYLLIFLLPLTLFAFESNEEIDALDIVEYEQQLLPKRCNSRSKEGEPRIYENLEIMENEQFDCSGASGFVVVLREDCQEVRAPSCVKPTREEMDARFEAFKVSEKAKLAARRAKEQRGVEREVIEAKLKDPAQRDSVPVSDLKRVLFEDK
jgi:hypothetical protein